MNLFVRRCCRTGCAEPAWATLTYDYPQATIVLGPLAAQASPGAYDLCRRHAGSLTAPQGWQVVRLEISEGPAQPSPAELEALAQAVRQASARPLPPRPAMPAGQRSVPAPSPAVDPLGTAGGRRNHLRLVQDPAQNGD